MMATNPKLPDFPEVPRRRSENEHAKVQMIRQSKFPWPLVVLIGAAALLIAIFALLPRTPHLTKPPTGAQIPQQPTADQVQPVAGAQQPAGRTEQSGLSPDLYLPGGQVAQAQRPHQPAAQRAA